MEQNASAPMGRLDMAACFVPQSKSLGLLKDPAYGRHFVHFSLDLEDCITLSINCMPRTAS
jgi:hypothetical protein